MAPKQTITSKKVSDVRTKKDKLRNDLLSYMEGKELMWPEKELSIFGNVFVQSLVDTLWYLDGHHGTFNERSHHIPPIFDKFTGYNSLQLHKHRKRSSEILSAVSLTDHSNKLFKCLQECYWERMVWRVFKPDVELLAKSLSDYARYLRDQNKKMKITHRSMVPVRSLADNLSFQILPISNLPSLELSKLEEVLCEKGMFEFVSIENVISHGDPRKKYEFMNTLKCGLSVRTAELTCCHGNNIFYMEDSVSR